MNSGPGFSFSFSITQPTAKIYSCHFSAEGLIHGFAIWGVIRMHMATTWKRVRVPSSLLSSSERFCTLLFTLAYKIVLTQRILQLLTLWRCSRRAAFIVAARRFRAAIQKRPTPFGHYFFFNYTYIHTEAPTAVLECRVIILEHAIMIIAPAH